MPPRGIVIVVLMLAHLPPATIAAMLPRTSEYGSVLEQYAGARVQHGESMQKLLQVEWHQAALRAGEMLDTLRSRTASDEQRVILVQNLVADC